MSDPYIGEIRMFGGNFAPQGWALCQGQELEISEHDALFNLIGTTYGGDGQGTFALPNLQGRVPVHQGNGPIIGETAGVEQVTLTAQQIPVHTHAPLATNDQGSQSAPGNALPGSTPAAAMAFAYGTDEPTAQIDPSGISAAGGGQPHDNVQPYLCINFIISLFGVYPSRD